MIKIASMLMTAALLLTSCTATQLGQTTEQVLILRGKDPETAGKIGGAVGGIAGSVAPMPLETEMSIGEGVALKSFSSQGRLLKNPSIQEYVNLVGMSVATAAPRQIPYTFAVVESEAVNAWAAPGGYVFITTSALLRMEDEAMLAGVLAHELAHVNERHMVHMIQRAQLFDGAIDLAEATKENVAKYTASADFGQKILFEKGFDRNMELDADTEGIGYATLAGYDPTGLARFLEKLDQGTSGGGWLSSTHPSVRDRVRRLQQTMAVEYKGLEGVVQAERFRTQVLEPLTAMEAQ